MGIGVLPNVKTALGFGISYYFLYIWQLILTKFYMETNVVNSKSIMLKNGLYLGLAIVAVNVIMYVSGLVYSGSMVAGFASGMLRFAIMILFVVWGIKQFKMENSGFLMLAQALKVGIGIALVSALVEVAYNLLFTMVIEPDFADKMFEVQKTVMLEQNPNLTTEQLEAGREMSKKFSSPMFTIPISIVWNLFLGLIISLVAGAIMQKKEQTF